MHVDSERGRRAAAGERLLGAGHLTEAGAEPAEILRHRRTKISALAHPVIVFGRKLCAAIVVGGARAELVGQHGGDGHGVVHETPLALNRPSDKAIIDARSRTVYEQVLT